MPAFYMLHYSRLLVANQWFVAEVGRRSRGFNYMGDGTYRMVVPCNARASMSSHESTYLNLLKKE
jgi:hypothetical protein